MVHVRGPKGDPPSGWNYNFHLETEEFAFDTLKGDDSLWVLVWGTGLPRPVYLRLGIAEGRLTCTGLFIGFELSMEPQVIREGDSESGEDSDRLYKDGTPVAPGGSRPILGKDLRSVSLPEILGALEPDLDRWLAQMEAKGLASKLIERRLHGRDAGRLPRPGPRGPSPAEIKAIAAEYSLRVASTTDVGRVAVDMAEEMGREVTAIYRWLNRARDLGYLNDRQPREEDQ